MDGDYTNGLQNKDTQKMNTNSSATTVTAQKVSLEDALIKCNHNAHLIASAPELLEACKLLAKVFNASNFTDRGGYGPMLTALIAKAEGRA